MCRLLPQIWKKQSSPPYVLVMSARPCNCSCPPRLLQKGMPHLLLSRRSTLSLSLTLSLPLLPCTKRQCLPMIASEKPCAPSLLRRLLVFLAIARAFFSSVHALSPSRLCLHSVAQSMCLPVVRPHVSLAFPRWGCVYCQRVLLLCAPCAVGILCADWWPNASVLVPR